jgi:hypothetical protein
MISVLLHRLSPKAPAHAPAALTRIEVCPPQRPGAWQRFARELRGWLPSGWPRTGVAAGGRHWFVDTRSATTPLGLARRDFIDAIDDIDGTRAERLTDRICAAASLADLWHLRTDVFVQVAQQFDQHEAESRLATLNRHFPTRSPRSGFGALDSLAR